MPLVRRLVGGFGAFVSALPGGPRAIAPVTMIEFLI